MLNNPVVQLAYFVRDAEQAALRAAERLGAGPFFLIPRIELAWGEHRGRPQTFLHTSAYGQWGGVMLEFVQQDEEGPSPFRDLYRPGEEGLHHVAQMVDSLPETYRDCERQGLALAARAATRTGTEFAFVDSVALLGHMIEVYEKAPGLLAFYERVRAAAVGWNGQDAIRRLG